jgi:hypothetical protein
MFRISGEAIDRRVVDTADEHRLATVDHGASERRILAARRKLRGQLVKHCLTARVGVDGGHASHSRFVAGVPDVNPDR